MGHLRLFLQKDLLVWRNSYWRTRGQAAGTLAVAAVMVVIAGLVIRALLRWFSPIVEMFPGALAADMLSPLVLMLLAWLLVSTFFTTAMLSREHFFHTPDLALLIATPVKPIIIFALRFLFLALAPLGLLDVVSFGLAPLAALGLMAAAPWSYYALLLPVLYLYRIIPAVFAVTSIMLLARALRPRRLYQALAVGNFLFGGLPLFFYFGDQQALLFRLTAWLADAELVAWGLAPVAAMRDLILGLMRGDVGVWLPLVVLSGSVAAFVALASAVVERVYFRNYERLQTAERRPPKKVWADDRDTRGATRAAGRPLLWFLVVEHWKTAARNREMLYAGIFFISLLPVYVVMLERFFGGLPWVMLVNVAVVAFCAQLATLLMLYPFAVRADLLVLRRQYWFYKTSPVEERTFVGSLFLAHCLPSLALALALIVPVSHFTGLTGGWMLPATGLLTLLVVSSVALQQLTELLQAASFGEKVPLLSRVVREAAQLYGLLLMLPAATALYYRQLGPLSFMHGWPQSAVTALAATTTVALAIVVTRQSLQSMATVWRTMEIK